MHGYGEMTNESECQDFFAEAQHSTTSYEGWEVALVAHAKPFLFIVFISGVGRKKRANFLAITS